MKGVRSCTSRSYGAGGGGHGNGHRTHELMEIAPWAQVKMLSRSLLTSELIRSSPLVVSVVREEQGERLVSELFLASRRSR